MMQNQKTALIISDYGMGVGKEELKLTLIKNYFSLLVEGEVKYSYICLYGDGVKLACKGSVIIEEISELEKRGTKIIICKTCLNFNGLLDQVKVGTVGTMLDISGIHNICNKIVKL